MRERTWVLYRWGRKGIGDTSLHVGSKRSWQSSKKRAIENDNLYIAEFVLESTDRVMLEQMIDLTKEE